jgi:hypothetical protein
MLIYPSFVFKTMGKKKVEAKQLAYTNNVFMSMHFYCFFFIELVSAIVALSRYADLLRKTGMPIQTFSELYF